jgi:uncharacterized protein YdeI (YjbR/CyaY-like superfamily)
MMNPKIDDYLSKAKKWQPEMALLRSVILDCGLEEDLKWGKPCYSYKSSNLVVIQGFKEYLAILFFKGVLLSDPDGILRKTGENTVVGRQIRFKNLQEIAKLAPIIKAYIYEAIELEKAGVKVERSEKVELDFPAEFQEKMDEIPALQTAFDALTPGRRKAYLIHFSQPKQAKTREARIEKYIPKILEGKGLDDFR